MHELIHKEDTACTVTNESASVTTAGSSTSPSTEALTNQADTAPQVSSWAPISATVPASTSALAQAKPSPHTEPDEEFHHPGWLPRPDEDSKEGKALENRKEHARSLAETLLLALGIPYEEDTDEVKPVAVTIEPPITAAKVAAQIGAVTNALLTGQLSAQEANTTLFALQTLLTAIRVNLAEEKAADRRTIEQTKSNARAQRSAAKCPAKPSRKTVSSPSRRPRKSR